MEREGTSKQSSSRRELTSTAIDCFARYGFQGSSIDRIAAMAGVTKGAIYYHFRDKEDLLEEAVRDRISEFESRVQRSCRGCGPTQALARIADVCTQHARSQDHPRFAITLMVETLGTNSVVAAELRDMMRRFRSFLKHLVLKGMHSGEFRATADAEAIAASYTGAVLGAEIQFYQDPEHFPFEQSLSSYLDQLMNSIATNQQETNK
ncbi:MAG: TetR/AcrR family transcriptional regulator [Deltaproteobacteria bacterium]